MRPARGERLERGACAALQDQYAGRMSTPLSIRLDARILERLRRRTRATPGVTPSGLAQRLVAMRYYAAYAGEVDGEIEEADRVSVEAERVWNIERRLLA